MVSVLLLVSIEVLSTHLVGVFAVNDILTRVVVSVLT